MRLKRNHAYFYQVCVQSQLDFKLLFLTQFVFFRFNASCFVLGESIVILLSGQRMTSL